MLNYILSFIDFMPLSFHSDEHDGSVFRVISDCSIFELVQPFRVQCNVHERIRMSVSGESQANQMKFAILQHCDSSSDVSAADAISPLISSAKYSRRFLVRKTLTTLLSAVDGPSAIVQITVRTFCNMYKS